MRQRGFVTLVAEGQHCRLCLLHLYWNVPFWFTHCPEVGDVLSYAKLAPKVVEAEYFGPGVLGAATLAELWPLDDDVFVRRDVLGGRMNRVWDGVQHERTSPVGSH